jgi:hypothetical protein
MTNGLCSQVCPKTGKPKDNLGTQRKNTPERKDYIVDSLVVPVEG